MEGQLQGFVFMWTVSMFVLVRVLFKLFSDVKQSFRNLSLARAHAEGAMLSALRTSCSSRARVLLW